MTTAARPTFDPAKGKETNEFTYLTSAKDLPGHTKLKTRKPGQGGDTEHTTVEELRKELEEAERRHFETKRLGHGPNGSEEQVDNQVMLESEKARYIEMAQLLDAESEESDEDDEESDDSEAQSDGEDNEKAQDTDSDEDSEDETALLLRELEKIKRERAEERAREEQKTLERRLMEDSGGPSLVGGNPLLGKRDFSVKRRWDDDVVFRNQARDEDDKPKKRFVNDMLRSDFHQKFMRKYMQ
ncbi:Cwf15/Cwc15 cell cycle control protein [Coemansia reversa NRRL 1564]|uniref:Cwf15/Cwc15 cell cycle control protein n=1 Tax=Coemansia reversa (strain ATCC 12441 / NRRL 1564) TaxID=763665 RepID=A0A2G5BG47_COERN|nr:Cwf15/Cwc15 cell cycle control protein [Coemansia reversa NRRL 1564]|eukprot:PIA17996.1 Cwf15/Cwc15 cell cycle control protein [Coemansia reversa NRRL 1564]